MDIDPLCILIDIPSLTQPGQPSAEKYTGTLLMTEC